MGKTTRSNVGKITRSTGGLGRGRWMIAIEPSYHVFLNRNSGNWPVNCPVKLPLN